MPRVLPGRRPTTRPGAGRTDRPHVVFRRGPVLVGAVVVALALGACGGSDGTDSADGPDASAAPGDVPWTAPADPADDGPTPSTGLLDRYGSSPLSAYTVARADVDTLLDVEDRLVSACMAERGLTYQPDYLRTGGDLTGDALWSDFLGVTDMDSARTTGYGAVRTPDQDARLAWAEEQADRSDDLPQDEVAYLVALYGPAAAGLPDQPGTADGAVDVPCVEQAARAMTPPGPVPNLSIQAELGEQASAVARADAAVGAAVARWTDCMASHGYATDSVVQPALPPEEVTQENIDQAVTDVTCKESTGLTDTYVTTLYAAEQRLIDDHLADLQAFADYTDARLRQAARALEDG